MCLFVCLLVCRLSLSRKIQNVIQKKKKKRKPYGERKPPQKLQEAQRNLNKNNNNNKIKSQLYGIKVWNIKYESKKKNKNNNHRQKLGFFRIYILQKDTTRILHFTDMNCTHTYIYKHTWTHLHVCMNELDCVFVCCKFSVCVVFYFRKIKKWTNLFFSLEYFGSLNMACHTYQSFIIIVVVIVIVIVAIIITISVIMNITSSTISTTDSYTYTHAKSLCAVACDKPRGSQNQKDEKWKPFISYFTLTLANFALKTTTQKKSFYFLLTIFIFRRNKVQHFAISEYFISLKCWFWRKR